MQTEHHHWYSHRLGRELGVAVFGHWGPPLLTFPTSGGDEWEYERQGLVGTLADLVEAGRIKLFCANSNHRDSFANGGAHPRHRSWMQAQYDEYVSQELFPFIRTHCRDERTGIWTMGASLGAYHAANTLFKHPDVVKRCYALSGVFDMKRFMGGEYDDNFYFNNPVDYLANMSDAGTLAHLASCEIHIATGSGPWEQRGEADRLSHILTRRGIAHHLDDWGPLGGHDWLYWKNQMRTYLERV